MYGWSFWIVIIVGFIFGACFGFIIGVAIADNYWRKNLIKKQHYDKVYNAQYEIEKETVQREHDNANKQQHRDNWW